MASRAITYLTALLVLAAVAVARPAHGATRYDPGLRFRSITTPHFVIHFHQGEELLARRLAGIAEEVHRELTARMGAAPPGRTHVVLVDQTDQPNGWATPVPYELIEITAAAPAGASTIGNTSDWLRLVFTHEYAHVLHLGRSRGWARIPRRVFGRVPFAFPNLTLPPWQIEGIATLEESAGGEGRQHAEDFHAIVTEAARAGRFEPLDRLGGGLVDWPDGHGWYAYGVFFHAFLVERYGRAKLRELSDRTAGRVPNLTSGAFEAVFGRSLKALWQDFQAAERAADVPAPYPDVERLTFHGHVVTGPRFDANDAVVYSRSDPHALPSIEELSRPGDVAKRLTSRIGGEHVALSADAIYFDQLEFRNNVSLTADLYQYERRTSDVRRLTHGQRLADPDLSPDGKSIAAIAVQGERRELVILRLDDVVQRRTDRSAVLRRVVVSDERSRIMARPRWSPDGRFIAAESRAEGVPSNIVIVDVQTGEHRSIVRLPGRNVTPAWTPDGRAIVFASDRCGPFDLYRVELAAASGAAERIERLTRLAGGAHSPDIARDGRTVVFVGYTPDGYDLFTMSLEGPTGNAGVVPNQSPVAVDGGQGERAPDAKKEASTRVPSRGSSDKYSPWSTLTPRAWLPVVEPDDDQIQVGAATGGADVLGYHTWSAVATWPVSRREELQDLTAARPNVQVAYVYDRWRPTFFAQVEDETTGFLAGGPETGRQALSIRDRSFSVGASLPFRRVRWWHSLTAAWHFEHRTLESAEQGDTQHRGAVRAGWAISTAKRFGYSISPEAGVSAGVASEHSRRAFGSDADTSFSRVDVRAFLPALPRHGVIAVRASGVTARGAVGARRLPRLGGADEDGGLVSFDEDATSLLRGFPANAFIGSTVALVNAEYRVPLGWPQRGIRTWPLFLKSIHAGVFADAGHAWNDRFRFADAKSSWGAELSADLTVFHGVPWTGTAGMAWGHDGATGLRNREIYVRVGHGF